MYTSSSPSPGPLVGSPGDANGAILLPLEDASPSLLSGRLPTSSSAAQHVVTSASADLQRSLLQQQLQQSQRELRKLKDELYDMSARLGQVTTSYNEQKVELSSLTQRYDGTLEKLTSAEADVRRLEEQLVQERTRLSRARDEKEQLRLHARELGWEVERLQGELVEMERQRGLDPREVQRLLEDRSQYLPTAEVRRMQSELRGTQQCLLDRLTAALDGLGATSEETETGHFVARSAVLSAATDLESRVLRAESTLHALHEQLSHYKESLDDKTNQFVQAIMSENKELWQHLTTLQSEHDLVTAELQRRQRHGEMVPADQHAFVQRQLESTTDRLAKAQQVVAAQTALAKEHEEEMRELLRVNDLMREKLESISQQYTSVQQEKDTQARALSEADTALREATRQVESQQDTLARERAQTDETLAHLNAVNTTMQQEYEQRLRQLNAERTALEEKLTNTQRRLEDTALKLEAAESESATYLQDFEMYKQRSEEAMERSVQAQLSDVAEVRRLLEAETEQLRRQLEEAAQEARAAVRTRDEALAESHTTQAKQRGLEAEIKRLQGEGEEQRRQLAAAVTRLREVTEALEQLRAEAGEGGAEAKKFEKQQQRLMAERAALATQLAEEQRRFDQRYSQLQKDWRTSERARASLQDEIKALRARCAELTAARHAEERQGHDREQLMKENIRLHEQYQQVQQDSVALREQLQALRSRQQAEALLSEQLGDLQYRLRELPLLRQAADEARRDALKAKEDTEVLRRERDDMAAKLDYFLEESKAAARLDESFSRAVQDADAARRRLGGQLSAAKDRSDYRVFSNTNPAAASLDRLAQPTRTATPQARTASRSPRGAPSSTSGLSPAASARAQPYADAAVAAGESAQVTTPQRPWR